MVITFDNGFDGVASRRAAPGPRMQRCAGLRAGGPGERHAVVVTGERRRSRDHRDEGRHSPGAEGRDLVPRGDDRRRRELPRRREPGEQELGAGRERADQRAQGLLEGVVGDRGDRRRPVDPDERGDQRLLLSVAVGGAQQAILDGDGEVAEARVG